MKITIKLNFSWWSGWTFSKSQLKMSSMTLNKKEKNIIKAMDLKFWLTIFYLSLNLAKENGSFEHFYLLIFENPAATWTTVANTCVDLVLALMFVLFEMCCILFANYAIRRWNFELNNLCILYYCSIGLRSWWSWLIVLCS